MAHRSDGVELVRSVGSPSADGDASEKNISLNEEEDGGGGGGGEGGDGDAGGERSVADNGDDDPDLPQCKIRRNYSCNLCPFFSQNPRSFLYHSRDVHLDRIKIYECSQCLYASKHSQKLQRHINMIHVAGKSRVKRGNRPVRAERKREPRPIKPKPPEPSPDPAPPEIPEREDLDLGDPEAATAPETEADADAETENGGCEEEETVAGAYKCSLCNFANGNARFVRRHEKIVHLKKRFLRCGKCSYVTHVKARYTKHVKYHSMPMIKCDLCDFRTPYKWNLDRHYKNHSGTGAFQCSKCNFRADIKQSLTVHEMNHHVPPVGQGAIMARRRNKVGASEALLPDAEALDHDEMDLFRMERDDSDSGTNQEADEEFEDPASFQNLRNVKIPYSNKRESANNNHLQTDFIHPDDVVPRYGQIFVKNLKCKFCSYKAVFSHEIWRHEKRIHGYVRPENKKENAAKRPPPKLIPILNKGTPAGAILKIPSVRNKVAEIPPETSPGADKPVNEKEFNEMCKKSSLTSSLKDFVSLIGDEEGLKTIPDSSLDDLEAECSGWTSEPVEDSEVKEDDTKQKQTDLLKKKNASFFDKLKEKLMTGNSEEQSLFCEVCGHESKCLSEAVAHQKRHSSANYRSEDDHPENDVVLSGAELSSTRCQHCRQRCKTSTDLINHLKSCKAFGATQTNASEANEADEADDEKGMLEIASDAEDPRQEQDREEKEGEEGEEKEGIKEEENEQEEEGIKEEEYEEEQGTKMEESEAVKEEENEEEMEGMKEEEEEGEVKEESQGEEGGREEEPAEGTAGGEPMEKRVFVWNDLRHVHREGEEEGEAEGEPGGEGLAEEEGDGEGEGEGEGMEVEPRLKGEPLTTLPGYGTVTSKGSDNTESGNLVMEADPHLNLTLKKVFKCPHCSFWASTASRFHVHIVGHLNKKPFECSLCLYRSNWRWDITKHIRLKSLRDPSHSEAKVNMTDETGRRNYSKYNRFLTMMRVQEPTAESSGSGRRSRPSDATQGNVTEKDIVPLPAPPRLTRAPTPGVSHQVPQGVPLRPPPPLKAAHQLPPLPSLLKSAKEMGKKTFWKCKKCSFRDTQKGRVLLHVKKHYMFKKGDKCNSSSSVKSATSGEGEVRATESRSLLKTPSYRCGHCHQVSNWKHVIQRHCKLKHNGDALIQVGWKEEPQPQADEAGAKAQPKEEPVKTISCDICPFTTKTEGDLTAHKLNHVDRPGSIFKCTYCPFYVPSKIAVLEHMEIHGIKEGFDLSTLKVDNFDPSECNVDFTCQSGGGAPGESSKRYKCRQCPYLSNSRTQFLYHKQFHRPRDSPFKCLYCTYNVSRRHLLHQHLRVHHDKDSSFSRPRSQRRRTPDAPKPGPRESQASDAPKPRPQESRACGQNVRASAPPRVLQGNKASGVPEIPLVWVVKSGNIQKMFKCRWCPHVNARKINILEHEKMHRPSEKHLSMTGPKLQCADCTYTCNNPGVLASHMKVHQGCYGEIRSLVDPTRSDSEQIQELQKSLRVVEPEVVLVEEPREVAEELLSSQPENAYSHAPTAENGGESKKFLSFCDKCPARFFFKKELRIHSKFHMIHLPFRCYYCTYTARQRPHLLAHYKVHGQEYQERTAGLIESYAVCPDSPQPKTAVFAKESYVMEGPVWTVVGPEASKTRSEGHQRPSPKHACHRCPAKFFKSVALQYHLTLHGGSFQHKCKYCDYAVKTYGNLIKHQLVHEVNTKETASEEMKFSYPSPVSGTDLLKQPMGDEDRRKRRDPQFGSLMFGSPDFIYPTYLKNGKIKQKRYKCHKCPSAFEKRDQYRIHLSLHGSKQKYRCEKCDYSVKYYANYIQHLKKHQTHDEALKATSDGKDEEPIANSPQEEMKEETMYELTLLEQQNLLMQERKKCFDDKEEEPHVHWCSYCPYVSNRRDAVDSHERRHRRVSGAKSGMDCIHCDYSALHGNFLREHLKLHFNGVSRHKAEAYLKCEKMELWCCDEEAADDDRGTLVFRDGGEEGGADRFYPPIDDSHPKENDWKIYVNLETGEPVDEDKEGSRGVAGEDSPLPDSPPNDDLIEMIEEQTDEVAEQVVVEQVKPKIKRHRGKNWKCKKCPHAFGKRDQYLRHFSLHGSNQRHQCDICDYSVKFYTNYVQHMRMHQTHEPDKVIYVKKNVHSLETSSKRKENSQLLAEFPGDSDSCPSLEGKANAEVLARHYSGLDNPFADALLLQDCAKKEDSNPRPVLV